jgi:hypothetical protein
MMKGMGEVVRDDVKTFIEYVVAAMENKYLTFPAARAFKEICGDHAPVIQAYAAQIIDKVIPQTSASHWNTKREYECILEGVGFLVKNCQENQQCEAMIKRVI